MHIIVSTWTQGQQNLLGKESHALSMSAAGQSPLHALPSEPTWKKGWNVSNSGRVPSELRVRMVITTTIKILNEQRLGFCQIHAI